MKQVNSRILNDLLFLINLGFLAIIIILIPFINPIAKKEEEGEPPQGNMIVSVRWPDEADCDVDLWVQAPGERPVGYSNKDSKTTNLLRDDLGHYNDPSPFNMEITYVRKVLDGEYTTNLHMFRDAGGCTPVKAYVEIRLMPEGSSRFLTVYTGNVTLSRQGEEVTVYRFTIKDKELVGHSFVFKPLRSATTGP